MTGDRPNGARVRSGQGRRRVSSLRHVEATDQADRHASATSPEQRQCRGPELHCVYGGQRQDTDVQGRTSQEKRPRQQYVLSLGSSHRTTVHTGATWRIRLNYPCAAATQLYVELLDCLLFLTVCGAASMKLSGVRPSVRQSHYSSTAGPILSVFSALIVHSELKSVHPGFPVAFIF